MKKEMTAGWFRELQETLCRELEKLDSSGKFSRDSWERNGGGGGLTRVLEKGSLIEKGGVNFSEVFGRIDAVTASSLDIPANDFYATGISVVLHPCSPMIPIIHMNTRYFEMASGEKWFGGGIDLTPHYVFPEDAVFFHRTLKEACDRFDPDFYPDFKKEADTYFYIRHRKETRGIGGIFFDRLTDASPGGMERLFDFTREVGKTFLPIYTELVNRNRSKTWGETERRWQELRRGRYVEFNLVWDKGTKFGLATDGRSESILMSLPNTASWKYDHRPFKGSAEGITLQWLKTEIDWINLKIDKK